MKNIKLLFMLMFSLLSAKMMLLSWNNYSMYGLIDALPYAFMAGFFITIAGYINENMRKD